MCAYVARTIWCVAMRLRCSTCVRVCVCAQCAGRVSSACVGVFWRMIGFNLGGQDALICVRGHCDCVHRATWTPISYTYLHIVAILRSKSGTTCWTCGFDAMRTQTPKRIVRISPRSMRISADTIHLLTHSSIVVAVVVVATLFIEHRESHQR